MKILNASTFEQYNVHVKRVCCQPSKRLFSCMVEMVRVINQDINNNVIAGDVQVSTEGN